MALLDKSWLPAAALTAVSAAVLLTAFLMEHFAGHFPCELCWYQRYAHMATFALALPALVLNRHANISAPLLAAAALAILIGAAIAAYHVGVEQSWYESACATRIVGDTIEELRASLLAAPLVRCDEVLWSLWGISMAGWNAMLSLVLGGGALYAAYRMEKTR
ncbi:MAG: disulfide bond formation protein B [Alphaproteobacteria bacterium]|nr:disulfide bond formation protein B [Alphaproteobacteria bacterium]|tara:strand:+ start:957 stop:1445 length:489 start_codon:yes stop_codon:yes gene_type:complete